ncbi:MAG: ABC transporter permease [Anaerolineae bacterium]|nr:ABC transporter permease [Anaerolineae bacterium]
MELATGKPKEARSLTSIPLVRSLLSQEGVLLVITLVAVAILSAQNTRFLTTRNITREATLAFEVAIVAMPMTFIIITGGIDLSVGSTFGLAAIVLGFLWQDGGWPLELAILGGIATGFICGLINGLLIVRVGVPPMITTLATLALYRGMATGISEARSARGFPDWFVQVGRSGIELQWGTVSATPAAQLAIVIGVALLFGFLGYFLFRNRAQGSMRGGEAGLAGGANGAQRLITRLIGGALLAWVLVSLFTSEAGGLRPAEFVPTQVLIMIVFFVIAAILLSRTTFGRALYAIGNNETAARFAGIPVGRYKLIIYTLSGVVAAFAASFFVSRYTTTRSDMGTGMELDAIAAVLLGGTSILGGSGSIPGTVLGLILMQVLKSGLLLAGIKGDATIVMIGLILIVSILVNNFIQSRLRPR